MRKVKTPKYDFSVSLLDLKTSNGIKIPQKAVYRSDLKKVIAVVGADYQLVRHAEVLARIEETLPIITGTRTIHVCKQGNYMFANYESNKIEPVEPRKGDIVKFRIQIFNSYNGRISLGMRLYALRLACLNGMTVPQEVSTIQSRHVSGVSITATRDAFSKKMEEFQKFAPVWSQWTKVKAPKGRMETFLKAYTSKGARAIIQDKFLSEQDDSLWGFFNSITWFGSHIVKVRNAQELPDNKVKADLTKIKDLAEKQFAFDRNVVEKFYKYNWN